MKPCAHPKSASSTTAPTITQSMPVNLRAEPTPATCQARWTAPERLLQLQCAPWPSPAPRQRGAARGCAASSRCSSWQPGRSRAASSPAAVTSRPSAGSRFASSSAWERGDYASMHAMLTPEAREQWPLRRFARAYRRARRNRDGRPRARRRGRGRPQNDAIAVPVDIRTRDLRRPAHDRHAPTRRAATTGSRPWRGSRTSCSAGCGRARSSSATRGCPSARRSEARDGTPIAKGEARLSDLDALASEIAGRVGPAPPERGRGAGGPGRARRRAGRPHRPRARVRRRLAGTPGGQLLAGTPRARVRRRPSAGATSAPRSIPTSSAPRCEALAGRYGGIAAVRPRNGEVLALAGVAFSAPQPPGSVFKIITLVGRARGGRRQARRGLPGADVGDARGRRARERQRRVLRRLADRHRSRTPATRCSRRWAPSWAPSAWSPPPSASGSTRTRELAGAARSTIPAAAEIGDDLAVGSTAIGQGKVLTTPLQMALIAADDRRGRAAACGRRCSRARRPRSPAPSRRRSPATCCARCAPS